MRAEQPARDAGCLPKTSEFGGWATRRRRRPGGIAARFVVLYLRSRLAGWASLVLSLLALASWATTWWTIRRREHDVTDGALIPLLAFATLAAACVVVATARSPFGDAELTAAYPLPPVRLGHLVGLLLFSASTLTAALLCFDLEGAWLAHPVLALLRNLAGFAGLALLAALVVGARLSWVVPLTFDTIAYITARLPDDTYARWAWHMQPGRDELSWAISLTLLAVGLLLVILFGTREQTGEAE